MILRPFGTPAFFAILRQRSFALNPCPSSRDILSMKAHSLRKAAALLALLATVSLPLIAGASDRSHNTLPTSDRPTDSSFTDEVTATRLATQESASPRPSVQTTGLECDGQRPPAGALAKLLNRALGYRTTEDGRLCLTPPNGEAEHEHRE